MRVPLEVLRLILLQVRAQIARPVWLKLRLVNSVFDEEICFLLFSHRDWPPRVRRLINGRTFDRAPPSLRRKYFHFRLKWHHLEPTVFSTLFLPVLDRRLAELGIADDDSKGRDAVMDELLQVAMPKQMSWTIAHRGWRRIMLMEKVWFELTRDWKNQNGRKQDALPTRALLRDEQIDNDYRYAVMACAIKKDDEDTICRLMQDEDVNLGYFSHCFGSTILKVAIAKGSIRILRKILEHHPKLYLETKAQYKFIRFAAQRETSAFNAVSLLLESSTASKSDMERLLQWSSLYGQELMVDKVLIYMNKNYDEKQTSALNGAVQRASRGRHAHIVRRLCDEVDVGSGFNGTSILRWIVSGWPANAELLHILIEKGVDMNKDGGRLSPLFRAVFSGRVDWVEELLKVGADARVALGTVSLLNSQCRNKTFQEISVVLERYGWDLKELVGRDYDRLVQKED